MLPIILAINNEDDRLLVEQIYETYERHMYMIAYGILHNKEDAEDAINNTVIKIIDYVDKFIDISCEETKRLIVIYTRSVAFNMYRSKQRRINLFPTISDDERVENVFIDEDISLQDMAINEETISIVRNAKRSYTPHDNRKGQKTYSITGRL